MSNFHNYLNEYEFTCVLPGSNAEIKYKPITTGQMKKLLIYENETNPSIQEKALDDLISSSVITEDFNINDLYLEDRFFLLIEIRKKSKGEIFEFEYKCLECKTKSIQKINLNELKVNKLENKDNFTLKLNDNISISLKHITRNDQKLLENYIDSNLSNTQKMVEMQILSYASSIENITTPEGSDNPDINEKKYLLENIPTKIFDKVRDYHNKNSFGVDFSYELLCPKCKNKKNIDIPLENFFF